MPQLILASFIEQRGWETSTSFPPSPLPQTLNPLVKPFCTAFDEKQLRASITKNIYFLLYQNKKIILGEYCMNFFFQMQKIFKVTLRAYPEVPYHRKRVIQIHFHHFIISSFHFQQSIGCRYLKCVVALVRLSSLLVILIGQ